MVEEQPTHGAVAVGFELRFTGRHGRSVLKIAGDPDRIRTCGPQIRNLMLYPAELRGPPRAGIGVAARAINSSAWAERPEAGAARSERRPRRATSPALGWRCRGPAPARHRRYALPARCR